MHLSEVGPGWGRTIEKGRERAMVGVLDRDQYWYNNKFGALQCGRTKTKLLASSFLPQSSVSSSYIRLIVKDNRKGKILNFKNRP